VLDLDHPSPSPDLAYVVVDELLSMLPDELREGHVMCPSPDQVEEIESFCRGYMMGVDLDDIWEKDDVAMEPVAPIAVLAGVEPLNHPDDPDPIEDEEGFLRSAREQLPALVLEAFANTEVYRRPQPPERGGYRRDAPKIGRNDPCPCGSGKKYKQCCLETTS
jgi:uncharacterized protein